ncbi:MAG: hypothetical protein R3C28_13075 [Pirellulaceae bacterium]
MMRLIDYFAKFNMDCRETLAYSTRMIHYRQAVNAYAECFGESVSVDHITAASLEHFRQWWLGQPSKRGATRTGKTARRYCRTLRMIAAHADPSKFPEQRSGLFPLVENSLTTWTKRHGVREDEATVSRLRMMLGRDLAVDELTAELIERFDAWLDAQDLAPVTKRKRKSGIRLIARKSSGLIMPAGIKLSPETPDGSLRQLLELYRTAKPDTAKTTIGIYRTSIKRFAEFLGREPMLADLTDDCVGSFLEDRAKTAAIATVVCNRRCIVVLWRFAFFNDLVDRHPKRWRSHALLGPA